MEKTKLYRIFNDMDEIIFQLRKYLNNFAGHDYNYQTIEQIVDDERQISEISFAFAKTLAMISQGMDHQKWDQFWDSLGAYIYEEEDE